MDARVIVVFLHGPTVQTQRPRSDCWVALLAIGRGVSENHLARPSARPPRIRMTRLPEAGARLLVPLKPFFAMAPAMWRRGTWAAGGPPGAGKGRGGWSGW